MNLVTLRNGSTLDLDALPDLPLYSIAAAIRADWRNKKGPSVYFGAVPYLDAMFSLNETSDRYGADSGDSIVIYFLSNASAYTGPAAKAIKAELRKRIGQ